jgi:hypothetical protein
MFGRRAINIHATDGILGRFVGVGVGQKFAAATFATEIIGVTIDFGAWFVRAWVDCHAADGIANNGIRGRAGMLGVTTAASAPGCLAMIVVCMIILAHRRFNPNLQA